MNKVVFGLSALVVAGLCYFYMSHLKVNSNESCVERLSLISKATGMYCNDYDGWYPHVSTQTTESTFSKFKYVGSHELWSQALSKYIEPSKLYCPTDPTKEYEVSMALVPRYFGTIDGNFALNENYMPRGYPLNRSNTPYVADVVLSGYDKKQFSAHGDKFNILYLDGHVKSEKLN